MISLRIDNIEIQAETFEELLRLGRIIFPNRIPPDYMIHAKMEQPPLATKRYLREVSLKEAVMAGISEDEWRRAQLGGQ